MGSIRLHAGTGKLFFDFRYQGQRRREYTVLADTAMNRKKMKVTLDRIETEIKLGTFDYARHFPNSKAVVRLAAATAQSTISFIRKMSARMLTVISATNQTEPVYLRQ